MKLSHEMIKQTLLFAETATEKQKVIEGFFNSQLVKKDVENYVQANYKEYIRKGVIALDEWFAKEHSEEKQQRKQAVMGETYNIVSKIYCVVMAIEEPLPIVSVAGMCVNTLQMQDTVNAIQTMTEIITTLAYVDFYDVYRKGYGQSFMVRPKHKLPTEMLEHLKISLYLPPSITVPVQLKCNTDTGYKTLHGRSLISGRWLNHHDGDICLDTLNKLNRNQYELDIDFIQSVTEQNKTDFKEEQDMKNWDTFMEECQFVYSLLKEFGNKFYMTHKVDKRGRIYVNGYHINPQGASYKKAMLNLAHKEIIEGEL